jgi:hypothetical protein
LSDFLVVRERSVLLFGVVKAISALAFLSFNLNRLLGWSRFIGTKVSNCLDGSWSAMDALGAFLTGRRLQVVLWWTTTFHLDYLVAPVLTSGSSGSRDAGVGGSIGVKGVLVILALSLLSSNGWLRVEATIHKVYVVTVRWASVSGVSLHSGVAMLLMRDSHVQGAVLEFTLVKMGTVASSTV